MSYVRFKTRNSSLMHVCIFPFYFINGLVKSLSCLSKRQVCWRFIMSLNYFITFYCRCIMSSFILIICCYNLLSTCIDTVSLFSTCFQITHIFVDTCRLISSVYIFAIYSIYVPYLTTSSRLLVDY